MEVILYDPRQELYKAFPKMKALSKAAESTMNQAEAELAKREFAGEDTSCCRHVEFLAPRAREGRYRLGNGMPFFPGAASGCTVQLIVETGLGSPSTGRYQQAKSSTTRDPFLQIGGAVRPRSAQHAGSASGASTPLARARAKNSPPHELGGAGASIDGFRGPAVGRSHVP